MKLMVRAHDLGVKGETEIAKRLTELGLDGVQLVSYKSLDDIKYEAGSITEARAGEIASTISRVGEIALLGAYFNPVHPDKTKIERGMAVFTDYLRLARTFGAPAVGSESGSYMGDPWGYHPDNLTDEALNRVVAVFGELTKRAESFGTNIAIEGAYNHVLSTPERLKTCLDRINSKSVKVIIDLYNYLDISNVDTAYDILDRAITLFGDITLLYHIKDFVIEDGRLRQVGVGKGTLDLGRVLARIYKSNPNAHLVLEGTTGDDLPYAIAHIKNIITTLS